MANKGDEREKQWNGDQRSITITMQVNYNYGKILKIDKILDQNNFGNLK